MKSGRSIIAVVGVVAVGAGLMAFRSSIAGRAHESRQHEAIVARKTGVVRLDGFSQTSQRHQAGFLVDHGVVLTLATTMAGPNVDVTFHDGTITSARGPVSWREYALGILHHELRRRGGADHRPLWVGPPAPATAKPLRVSSTRPSVGTRIHVLGIRAPHGRAYTVPGHVIRHTNTSISIRTHREVPGAARGTPILDSSGAVVALYDGPESDVERSARALIIDSELIHAMAPTERSIRAETSSP